MVGVTDGLLSQLLFYDKLTVDKTTVRVLQNSLSTDEAVQIRMTLGKLVRPTDQSLTPFFLNRSKLYYTELMSLCIFLGSVGLCVAVHQCSVIYSQCTAQS